MRLRWAIALAIVTGGCTLLTSASDLTVEGEDAGVVDAALAEVAPPPDVGVPDTGPKGFCASLTTTPFLCDDFDDLPLEEQWQVYRERDAGVAVDEGGLSPPNALHLHYPDLTGFGFMAAALQKRLVGSPKEIDVALSIWVEERSGQALDVVTIQQSAYEFGWEIAGNSGRVNFDTDRPNIEAGTGQIGEIFPTTALISSGRWVSVRLHVVVGDETASGEIFVDGASVGTHIFRKEAFVPDALLTIGDDGMTDSNSEWRAKIDDVVVTLVP